jgi:hypothetical protein
MMNKSTQPVLKWIFGLFFLIFGIALLSEMILTGIIAILIGLFLIPPFLTLFEKRINFDLPSYLRWTLLMVGLMMLVFSIGLHEKKILENADLLVEEATVYIDSGELELAFAKIAQAKSIYTTNSNKAVDLENEINESQSVELVKRTLIEMSDDEFNQLQNGSFEFDLFQHETLNNNFIELLSKHSEQRKTLIADHEKRLREERIEAEKRVEEERIAEIQRERKAEEEARKKRIESTFSAWDGSHRGLVEYVKNNMNDPRSFEHVETKYGDRGNHLIVEMRFRGKNAFGGVVVNSVRARCGLDGNVIEIISTN